MASSHSPGPVARNVSSSQSGVQSRMCWTCERHFRQQFPGILKWQRASNDLIPALGRNQPAQIGPAGPGQSLQHDHRWSKLPWCSDSNENHRAPRGSCAQGLENGMPLFCHCRSISEMATTRSCDFRCRIGSLMIQSLRFCMDAEAGLSPSRASYAKNKSATAPSELVAIARTLASCIGSDLESVSTQLHAAPASSPFLACVVEVQHALCTLAEAVAIRVGEQHCRAVRQRGKQIFWRLRIEP